MLPILTIPVESRGDRNGQGRYSTGFIEIGFWIGVGAMDTTKPYKFIGFGAMDVTKPYKFIGFGKLWTRKLVQTLSQTYLGGTRDRF